MRILFVTDYFPPETNAAASRVYERARWWVQWGHKVTVVTSAPNFPRGELYDGYENSWYQVEYLGQIRVVRTKTFMARNRGRWKRSLDLLSFLFTALPVAVIQSRPDVIAATSPNFFAGLAGCLAAALRRCPFILEVGDLWPAFVVSLGEMRRSLVVRSLESVEMFMYRRARRIICLSKGFEENLISRGVDAGKISVIRNGVEIDRFKPTAADPTQWALVNPRSRVMFGYYGNLGAAQGLGLVLNAAERLPDVQFLLIGDGVDSEALRTRAERSELDNVVLLGAQPKDRIPDYLALCDVALVLLKDLPLLGHAIPSKMFEAMAMAKPILLSAPDGEAAEILGMENCGIRVEPGDTDALIQGIQKLTADRSLREELGANGRSAVTGYRREQQAERVLQQFAAASDSE